MALDPNARVPVYSIPDLPSKNSIKLSALVPNANPAQYIALYPAGEAPTKNLVPLTRYVNSSSSLLFIPFFASSEVPSIISVALSLLDVATSTQGVADFSNPANSGLITAIAA